MYQFVSKSPTDFRCLHFNGIAPLTLFDMGLGA